ncbi:MULTISPECIES: nitrite reductase large subunit NirB [unclassified Cryobacterium]|uniref:nitrite reductase large subunit NirB n=1 Tax=unclassified Cryobacterium TaxID=2649013 RepID=UPI00106939E6|nr:MULTISPECIES: nitrite reductase large subunit NirB [unclassified Cryobacterium]TFC57061.1 nitrite reductase large subunit [Cryobacterium sp. TMB3-1-2]TFC69501.1 nitrite reductase large subunit [Cryobacterium sp. TMB3-15]TFC77491.1 nitrite reductase large subunit [Cryobacterium sp. TMB3-10]TFD42861.1 nitrite reductase large subunit [Cryobacterium sp. TMB3-12]
MTLNTPLPTTSESDGVRRVIVIGGGPAAHRFTEAMVARTVADGDSARPVDITVIGEEIHLPYDRVSLSHRLNGPEDLTLGDPVFWQSETVRYRGGSRVTAVDPAARTVTLDNGDALAYDDLVFATGSSAFVPPVPGGDKGVVYRTIEDVDFLVSETARLKAKFGRPANVTVIGGGLLGLEAAGGVQHLGANTTIVDGATWLMPTQLDQGAGMALGRLIHGQGIHLELGHRPTEILVAETGQVLGLTLDDDRQINADLIVWSIGIRARDELARAAGLEIGPRGGIVIGDDCSSSVPGIWAIGEVASYDGRCIGLVAPANAMAEVVADRLNGGQALFPGIDDATKLKLSGVEVASFGDAFGTGERALEVVYADPARGLYQKVVVSSDAKTLLGGIFVGDASPYLSLRPLLGRELPAEPGAYLSASGAELPSSSDMPDDAQLCSCNDVSFGTVRAAIRGDHGDPVTELGALKACTRAGTQCGSCVPLLKKVLETELTAAGLEISKALCEHISISRSELFESVRVLQLTSFDQIMERFGTGLGCDVCKPTIASILASQSSAYILDAGRGGLQDTNDRALGNMQKDGSYSVIPRIPGGEITPEKLIAIGEVAAEFNLYTKITGGQRIALFGARLDQLPDIWRTLVDAGFESGQAYGKSLRTAKSCVGSAWCRFGVQDSVALAITLENRYRGLRSPHKFKIGVSGCARECAEARAKDIGVIATELGWNLYVGGNGGFQPVHAVLLAKDLDEETLIKYIDRYLMYYIRTADRVQRTARWQEDIEGGFDHVRDVVCSDSLGIADDLEAAMAAHIDVYEDEWAATLADPERLRRFRPFVNSDTPDPSLLQVIERGQPRPARPEERDGTSAAGPVHLAGLTIPVRRDDIDIPVSSATGVE